MLALRYRSACEGEKAAVADDVPAEEHANYTETTAQIRQYAQALGLEAPGIDRSKPWPVYVCGDERLDICENFDEAGEDGLLVQLLEALVEQEGIGQVARRFRIGGGEQVADQIGVVAEDLPTHRRRRPPPGTGPGAAPPPHN